MSEHELPDEDSVLSEFYHRSAAATPSPHLDAQVVSQARRQAMQTRDARLFLLMPVASVAVVVMAVGLLLHVVQAPPLQPQPLAERAPFPAAAPQPEVAPAMTPPARVESQAAASKERSEEKRSRRDRGEESRAQEQQDERPRSKKSKEPAASVFDEVSEGEAPAKVRVLAEPVEAADTKGQDNVPLAAARGMAKPEMAEAKQEEVATRGTAPSPEPAEVWMKRIKDLYAKGELEAARRELAAFRKTYPKWVIPKELLSLLPEAER